LFTDNYVDENLMNVEKLYPKTTNLSIGLRQKKRTTFLVRIYRRFYFFQFLTSNLSKAHKTRQP